MYAADQELLQYLFDLQGHLVIRDVLSAAEVAELNRLIDARRLPSPRESIRFGSAAGKHGPDHGFLNWGEPWGLGAQLLHEARGALSLCHQWDLRGVHGRGLEPYRCRTGPRGVLVYSRKPQGSRARVLPPPDVPLTPRQLTEPADPHTFIPSLFGDGPGAAR